ncbi:MAG: DNA mismatch repair endonuclease MutL [Chitinophagales bacterium]
MPDKIRLLPDTIANQIAAGEVIQRPASVVKELMENAIDSGATHIQLIVKNAGKTLVQVVDNGSGMSETDARLCFEKHATSKIRTIDDLFDIRTMGFRGEALASVAAIAQVEMKTRLHGQPLGTCIDIEGMKVQRQEPCQTAEGTSIAVKNLFFNVPARRNFLKSDPAELKHIIEEFLRIAISNPKVGLQFFSNDHEVFHYKSGNLKQRICAVFDEKYAGQIVPVEEKTYALQIHGFVGKPEFAKKTRGEQYIFVNNRYIKSPYLNHAIQNAYEQLLPKDSFPFYVLFLDVDPKRIDINVHPQKYEIKFEDEKLAYTFVSLAVKHALGAYSVMPSLDFNQEDHLNRNATFQQVPDWLQQPTKEVSAGGSTRDFFQREQRDSRQQSNLRHWEQVFQPESAAGTQGSFITHQQDEQIPQKEATQPYQIHKRYILSQIKSGFMLIDQQAAHERILFERFIRQLAHNHPASQRQLFPQTVPVNAADAVIMLDILPDINALGFDIQEFGQHTFVIHSFPADILPGDEKRMLEELLEQFKKNLSISKLNKRENLARSLAQGACIKAGKTLSAEEMRNLIDELFACENPYYAPDGQKTISTFAIDDLAQRFRA